MRTRFELGESVYVKAEVIRASIDPKDRKKGVMYDLAVKTSRGETLSINYLSEDQLESVVQK
jgi:hypothetical protein